MRTNLLLLFVLLSILLVGFGNFTMIYVAAPQEGKILLDRVVVTTPHPNETPIPQEGKILPDRVVVTTPYNGTPIPTTTNVTDPASAQILYNALYALPHAQKRLPSQWVGLGPVVYFYKLDFYSQNHLFKHVIIPNFSFDGFELNSYDRRVLTGQFLSLLITTVKKSVSH